VSQVVVRCVPGRGSYVRSARSIRVDMEQCRVIVVVVPTCDGVVQTGGPSDPVMPTEVPTTVPTVVPT